MTTIARFALAAVAVCGLVTSAPGAPLRVCATTPDLGSLVRAVGGADVDVTVFAKGTEDPHFVEPRPSFIAALSRAQLLVVNGLDLEVGWLPPLLTGSRNAAVQPGGRGYLDASRVVAPLGVPDGSVDRAAGDVHPFGNPHYLLDPVNGLAVADAIRGKLEALRPDGRVAFAERFDRFRSRLGAAMLGDRLGNKYPLDKIAELFTLGKLDAFLDAQRERELLGGWLALMGPLRGTKAVADHDVWPYFARRFGIDVVGFLEPRPGYPPTTRHLEALIATMRDQQVGLLLAATYYDPRHARFVAERTEAVVVEMATQPGARPDTDDYLAMIDYDVRAVAAAHARKARRP
ncbi:MAG TPA: metal ABC transporter substrate-binding protein [Candidatus Limnocylindria bacterium]|nr:metal ABC transporter substrate-binding protein [Candidatus Limnocylindria bacterium]